MGPRPSHAENELAEFPDRDEPSTGVSPRCCGGWQDPAPSIGWLTHFDQLRGDVLEVVYELGELAFTGSASGARRIDDGWIVAVMNGASSEGKNSPR